MNYKYFRYDEKYENDGSYMEFISYSDREIDNIAIDNIIKIIYSIKDIELKNNMKKRFLDYILVNGPSYYGISRYDIDNLFSKEDIDKLIERDFIRINELVSSDKSLSYNLSFVPEFIILIIKKSDNVINDINKIFNIVNSGNLEDIDHVNTNLLYFIYKYNKGIFNEVFNGFSYSYLESMDEYLKFINDKEYISKRKDKYLDKIIGIDKNISIGLEVEANNKIPYMINLYGYKGVEDYSFGSDATVPDGMEFSTSVMHDGDDISDFCAFCEAMNKLGFYNDTLEENTAGQINFGLSYLDSKEAVRNFFEIYCNVEELLFYISNNEGELIRQSVYSNSRSKPISELVGNRLIDENMTREDLLRLLYVDYHTTSSNQIGFTYKKNTVCVRDLDIRDRARLEFRIPNGSILPDVWIDNIRLYGKILEVSKKMANMRKDDYLSDRDERLLYIKEELKDKHSLEEKLYLLMELLFEDDKIKQIYINRYNTLLKVIKETNTDKYKDIYGIDPGFSNAELVDIPYRDSKYLDRVEYDSSTGEYIKNGKTRL